jgi:hypothetical protein
LAEHPRRILSQWGRKLLKPMKKLFKTLQMLKPILKNKDKAASRRNYILFSARFNLTILFHIKRPYRADKNTLDSRPL